MILVLAGTADGREIATRLSNAGYRFIACAATAHGGRSLENSRAEEIIVGRLNAVELAGLIHSRNVRLVVDATHPYAEEATINARLACTSANVRYIRFQRPDLVLPENQLIHPVEGYKNAAAKAVQLAGNTIFLATGIKTLSIFAAASHSAGKKLVVRVIPDPEGLRRCLELGIQPDNIVAIQGPFSAGLNRQLLIHYRADVLVTKESGITGGTDTKIEAALGLGIPTVLIKRPPAPEGALDNMDELLARIDLYERKKIK